MRDITDAQNFIVYNPRRCTFCVYNTHNIATHASVYSLDSVEQLSHLPIDGRQHTEWYEWAHRRTAEESNVCLYGVYVRLLNKLLLQLFVKYLRRANGACFLWVRIYSCVRVGKYKFSIHYWRGWWIMNSPSNSLYYNYIHVMTWARLVERLWCAWKTRRWILHWIGPAAFYVCREWMHFMLTLH